MDEDFYSEVRRIRDVLEEAVTRSKRKQADEAVIEEVKRLYQAARPHKRHFIIAAGFVEWNSTMEEEDHFTPILDPARFRDPAHQLGQETYKQGLHGRFEAFRYEISLDKEPGRHIPDALVRLPLRREEAEKVFEQIFEMITGVPAKRASAS